MTISAIIIADSINNHGVRLTTMQLRYPRFIHAEFMTHRAFCLAGDARLDFELPGKTLDGVRRIHSMSIKEFVDKWEDGAAKGRSSRHNGTYLSLPSRGSYTAREVAATLGFKNALNLNDACRSGLIPDAEKLNGQWVASAEAWEQWRNNTGSRRFSINKRLTAMSIRQIDEQDGRIRLSSVVAVQRSGVKNVYVLRTRNYEVAGSFDHLIFTKRGWVRIGDLVIGVDQVATYKYGTGLKEDPFRKIEGKWVSRWNLSVRNDVAARQDHKCAQTGKPLQSDFHIHHVEPRHKRPDLAFNIDNVVAVNVEAHRALHNIQGWQGGVPLSSGFEVVEGVDLRGEEETFDLEIAGEFPNFFANGIVVHNSRNASSSRAIPVKRLIEDVIRDTAMPIHWGKNQAGMQAREELTGHHLELAKTHWNDARDQAVRYAEALIEDGAHKQLVNRILEPFSHINVVVTATEWANFYALRRHADAQPEIKALADVMWEAQQASTPKPLKDGEWHLPYVDEEDWRILGWSDARIAELLHTNIFQVEQKAAIRLSVARCARVSYLTHDGKKPNIEDDLVLYDRLVGSVPLHASPAEHQARAGNQRGDLRSNFHPTWYQYRKVLEAR